MGVGYGVGYVGRFRGTLIDSQTYVLAQVAYTTCSYSVNYVSGDSVKESLRMAVRFPNVAYY